MRRLALIALALAALASYPLPHANYWEARSAAPSLAPLLSSILAPWSPVTGELANVSMILRLSSLLPVPLRYRLEALLNLTLELQEGLANATLLLDECSEALNASLLDEARQVLEEAWNVLTGCDVTMAKIRLIAVDLWRSYPASRQILEPRIEALGERLRGAWLRYHSLLAEFRSVEEEAVVESCITLNLDRGVARPWEPVRAWGTVSIEGGMEPRGVVELRLGDLRLQAEVINGSYEAVLTAPERPGVYRVEAVYRPLARGVRGSTCSAQLRVEPYPTELEASGGSGYPGGFALIRGSVASPAAGRQPAGVLVVEWMGTRLKLRVERGFEVKLDLPYYVEPGTYRARLLFKPFSPAFTSSRAEVSLAVLEPPYASSLEVSAPWIVLSGSTARAWVRVKCPCNATFRVLVKTPYSAVAIKVRAGEAVAVALPVPVDAWTGEIRVEAVAVPLNPLVRYSRASSRMFILNTVSVAVLAAALAAALILALRGRARAAPAPVAVVERPQAVAMGVREPLRALSVRDLLRFLINRLESAVCRVVGVEVRPSDTHREVVARLRERGWPLTWVFAVMVVIFERVYYGLRRVTRLDAEVFRRGYVRIMREVRRGG